MSKPVRTSNYIQCNLLLTPIKNFIKSNHELKILADKIDWEKIENLCEPFFSDNGRRAIPTRLMVGLHLLQYMFNVSEERLCAMWVENPYHQYFCGEHHFQHEMPIDRSSMSRWKKRIGAEKLEEILQVSLATANEVGALDPKDVEGVVVDTTVQEKMIKHPSEIEVIYDAIIDLGEQAKRNGLKLKENFRITSKALLFKASGYLRAKQMNRFHRCVKKMKWMLHKLTKRIGYARNASEKSEISSKMQNRLARANLVIKQNKTSPAREKIYSWYAPEVECIAKGKARARYEFGCKVSIVTNVNAAKGGHFILSAQAIHGSPFDGHTLKSAIEDTKKQTGIDPERIYVDRGYQGHDYEHKTIVFKSGQKRGVHGKIKQELRRRSVVEPIIGHVKHDHRMNKCRLKGQIGDKINAILAAIGFNFKQILNFIRDNIFWPFFAFVFFTLFTEI